jgi:hypothetical protein
MTSSANRVSHFVTEACDAAAAFVLVAMALTLFLPTAALADAWKWATSMKQARVFHTATLLNNGQVLVAGGYAYSSINPSTEKAELFDPTNGNWTYTGDLIYSRDGHTATLFPDGQVLVTGGFGKLKIQTSSLAQPTAELYDPEEGTWSQSNSMSLPRYNHRATLLDEDRVLVTGGVPDAALDKAEIYTKGAGFQSTGQLHNGRTLHTATLLNNGKVLVTGGQVISRLDTQTAELWDPDNGQWTLTGSLNYGRLSHTATLLPNGKVLVVGGYHKLDSSTYQYEGHIELYDPDTEQWTEVKDFQLFVVNHTATILTNGKVLVAGGIYVDPYHGGPTTTYLYNIKTSIWRTAAPNKTWRTSHTATRLPNGRVLVAGGWYGSTAYPSELCEIYYPSFPVQPIFQLLLLDN